MANEELGFSKANINWYPGHMEKAKRQMKENINQVDMVIEIRDSRIPNSSINPVLNEIIGNKKRLIILSKTDMADSKVTESFINEFNKDNYCIALDLTKSNVNNEIIKASKIVMAEKISKLKAKGLKTVEIKAMVVGIPNVGKSTLINSTSQKKAAKVENHPGVTKSLQWIKISPELALLDTPGVLWPKFKNQDTAIKLAIVGSINDSILPISTIVEYALDYLINNYKDLLDKRFNIVSSDAYNTYHSIAINRGCILPNGNIDKSRVDKLILKEIRDGLIGKISWEKVDEN